MRYLWYQLNGPQITAIFTAIKLYWESKFTGILAFWKKFALGNARGSMLDTIGILRGVPRPSVKTTEHKDFVFTEVPTRIQEDIGLSENLYGLVGFIFGGTDLYDIVRMPDNLYRILLLLLGKTESDTMSLYFLDTVLATLATDMGVPIKHEFDFIMQLDTDTYPTALTVGDIAINCRTVDWPRKQYVNALMTTVADTWFANQPRVYTDIEVT